MPEAEAEIGEGPKPEIPQKPEEQAVSRLSASLEKARGLSWETVKLAIKGRFKKAEKEAKKEGAGPKQIAELGLLRPQIEETAKALLEKGEGFDVSELSRQTREWIKAQKEKASPEAAARLEELEKGMDDFDTRQILGELSSDPEVLTKQLFVILAGPEGKDLVETVGEVVNQQMQEREGEREEGEEVQREKGEEKPYPWEPRPELKIGRSRWFDLRFLGCLLPLSWCVLSVLFSPEAGRRVIRRIPGIGSRGARGVELGIQAREAFSEAVKERGERQIREQVREEDARGLILGTYPYSRILGLEEQGNEDLALARLDRAAEFIAQGEYSLDQVHNPRLIARLIYDYREKYPDIFDENKIEDLEKKKQVRQFLEELEEKEVEETGYKPSLRKTAAARARQESISARAGVSKRVPSRRERGLV